MRVFSGLFAVAILAACGGGGGSVVPVEQNVLGLPSLAQLRDMNEASTAPDSDGDLLKDDIEVLLGTDPLHRDTDEDGLTDTHEVFGVDGVSPLANGGEGIVLASASTWVPNRDNDLLIAAVDVDDDGDGRHDGLTTDSDGDGVPNYFEYYGYRFEFLTGRFISRKEDRDRGRDHLYTYFRTDPLQPSTDQDPYPDGMEVSGVLMDVTVQPPGDHPLVPAYPNIVVTLEGYSATLLEEIQYEEGGSLSKGTEWSRETEQSYEVASEKTNEVGAEAGAEGWSFVGKVNYKHEWKDTTTNSTSTTVAVGGSVTSEQNWSMARSLNPAAAARLRLLLKVHNRGSAALSNVVPTLTLRIGPTNVATFQPVGAEQNIHILVPGATYPPQPGVFWVVDSIGGGKDLTISMEELRALEGGAPVSISMTQVAGDVMRQDPTGAWQSIGDVNEFLARIGAVGAHLRLDMGDGTRIHSVVYADDAVSAPPTTLGDALLRLGDVGADGRTFRYLDSDGLPRSVDLDGWSWRIDERTLRANGLFSEAAQAIDEEKAASHDLVRTRLGPASSILGRASAPPACDPCRPVIHYAYLDAEAGEVRVFTTDYHGIASVVLDSDDPGKDDRLPMTLVEAGTDTGLYASTGICEDAGGPLFVDVVNLRGESTRRDLALRFRPGKVEFPVIESSTVDLVK